jgi:hypothetical protein
MSFSHTIRQAWTSGARSISNETAYTGDAQSSIEAEIADSETDFLVNFALDVSQIAAIYIVSDQDITVETNDGSSPDDTLSLVAGVPYVWTTDSYDSCLLTVDITALYVTNSSGATATLQIEVVKDDTP